MLEASRVGEWALRAALLGAFAFSVFWGSRSFGLQDNNEGLYAEVAREMIARHDWIVPHLDGSAYLEKPPLLYWAIAGLSELFGEHSWVVRLGPVIFFGFTLLGIVRLARLMGDRRAGFAAGLIACSAAGIVIMSRSLLFDGLLAGLLTWQVGSFLKWRLERRRRDLLAFYAFLAVGVLAKGLLPLVLAGGAAVVATWLGSRSWREVRAIFDPRGLAVFFALAAPWHILAAARQPGFVDFYFLNEHVLRFLGLRQPHDFYTGPLYYYVARLPMYLGIWVLALPLLAPSAARRLAHEQPAAQEGRRLLACWFGIGLVFFSASEGKANYYLLSTMPALVLLLATAWPHEGSRSRRLIACAVGPAMLAAALAMAPFVPIQPPELAAAIRAATPLLLGTAALLALCAAIAFECARQGRTRAAFAALAIAGISVMIPAPPMLSAIDPELSQHQLAHFLRAQASTNVVFYRDYERLSSLPFYLRQTIPIVDSTSNELYYPERHHPAPETFLREDQFRRQARAQPTWVVATRDRADEALRRFHDLGLRRVRDFGTGVLLATGNLRETADADRSHGNTSHDDATMGEP